MICNNKHNSFQQLDTNMIINNKHNSFQQLDTNMIINNKTQFLPTVRHQYDYQ